MPINIGPGAQDKRGGRPKGPAKLSKVKTQANNVKSVKPIKAGKGLMPGDNIRKRK